jgi:predicted HAD superfamily phosphohydrolase YqeG
VNPDGTLTFVEVKAGDDRVKPHQDALHQALRAAELDMRVVLINDQTLVDIQTAERMRQTFHPTPEELGAKVEDVLNRAFEPETVPVDGDKA